MPGPTSSGTPRIAWVVLSCLGLWLVAFSAALQANAVWGNEPSDRFGYLLGAIGILVLAASVHQLLPPRRS